ncbi:MAG: hypothetical protein U0805_01700 [Pirellulales bacterium]
MRRILFLMFLSCAALGIAGTSFGVTVTVDPSATWLGFMNWYETPANGGAYAGGGVWGTNDLVATFSGPVLTLAPNSVNDPSPYWYTPSGGPGATGNKIMEANMYVEQTGPLSGQSVTFTGTVLSNTLTSAHSSVAFIKDFAPDYSSFNIATVPLTSGVFNVSLNTVANPARHVQFGFQTKGPNVWITDVAPYGSVKVTAVPEPASIGLALVGVIGCLASLRWRY